MIDYDPIIIGAGAGTVRIEILPQYVEALRANGGRRIYPTFTN